MTVTIVQLANPTISGITGNSSTWASAINASGEVVGYTSTSNGTYFTFWQNGGVTTTWIPNSPSLNQGTAINDSGEAVGGTLYNGFSLQNGTVTPLPALGGSGALDVAYGINNAGTIVGVSSTTSSQPVAVEWQGGTVTALGWLPGLGSSATSTATAINQAGQVVGYASTTGSITHAFSWQNGVMTDLGALTAADSSVATAINNTGEIVGTDTSATTYARLPVIWRNGALSQLPTLPDAANTYVMGVNDTGTVVGSTQEIFTYNHATAWVNGTAIDLNTLLPANSGWYLEFASGINASGQIVGTATYNGAQTNFEMTLGANPTPIVVSAAAALQSSVTTPVAIQDSAATILSDLTSLASLTYKGMISSIALTDSGIPVLNLTSSQWFNDGSVIEHITTPYSVLLTPSTGASSVYGISSALGTTVALSGTAASAAITPAGDGSTVGVTSSGVTDTLHNVQALKFSDTTLIVAQTPGATNVTGGNVTELYAAVLDREPDVPGLAYYQGLLKTNPAIPLVTFALDFLQSPEYTASHSYAETSTGDQQFITDSYQNLLHRAPEAGAVAWYQANVLNPILASAQSGTQAYATAELQAHATMLVDFSNSSEFLKDVQVTAQTPPSAQHWLVLV